MARRAHGRKRQRQSEKTLKVQNTDVCDQDTEMSTGGADRGPFSSSGGVSEGGISIAAMAEMGALSPVHEENTEIVTKNPMRAAIANGAQFYSSGGDSSRFYSAGGSSKFQSIGGGSSRKGEGEDDDEEGGGGMFADAGVVAVLAAAAAQQVESRAHTTMKKSGSGFSRWGWHQGSGGSWAKSPSWNRDRLSGSSRGEVAPSPSGTAVAERTSRDSARASASPAARQAMAMQWMVSTRSSFNSNGSSEKIGWLDALKELEGKEDRGKERGREKRSLSQQSPSMVGANGSIIPAAALVEEKVQEAEERAPSNATTAVGPPRPSQQAPTLSPQLVDGISPQAFGRAELIANELPAVIKERIVPTEPECEVPNPAAGPDSGGKKIGEYTWLSSSGRKLSSTTNRNDGHAAPVDEQTRGTSNEKAIPKEHVESESKTPSIWPTNNADLKRDATATAAVRSAASIPAGEAKVSRPSPAKTNHDRTEERPRSSSTGVEQLEAAALHLPPKAQGGTPRRTFLTPLGSAGRGFNWSGSDRIPASGKAPSPGRSSPARKSPSSSPTGKPSWLPPSLSIDRVSRVGQVANVFDRLTPRIKSAAVTPVSTSNGSAAWATPVATPDRTPRTSTDTPQPLPSAASSVNGSSRTWTTPVATPDRTPRTNAADPDVGGPNTQHKAIPEGAREPAKVGVSPTDERQYAWQLESPAGVDGLPSPSDSDNRVISARHKGGRIIPRILGVIDSASADGTTSSLPRISKSKGRAYRMNSSGDSSSGAGWDVDALHSSEVSFGASRVAAFVADARAEAAAEARAAVAEAQAEARAEAAEEDALAVEKKAREARGEAEAGGVKHGTQDGGRSTLSRGILSEGVEVMRLPSPAGYISGEEDTDADEGHADDLPKVALGVPVVSPSTSGEAHAENGKEGKVEIVEDAAKSTPHVQLDGAELTVAEAVRNNVGVAGVVRDEKGEVNGLKRNGEREQDVRVVSPARKEGLAEETALDSSAALAALVAEAMALAGGDGMQVDKLHCDEGDNAFSDTRATRHGDGPSSHDDEVAPSSQNSVRSAIQHGGAFGSSKSILNWTDGDVMEEGDAERDADEVQALVAEALALVKEADEDAKVGVDG